MLSDAASQNAARLPAQDYATQAEQDLAAGDWRSAAEHYALAAQQSAAELALINSVQEGLSAKLEMQAIYNLVGDKIRDTFNAQVVMISQYDGQTNKIYHHYAIERGQHLSLPGWKPIDTSRAAIVHSKRPFWINLQEIIALVENGRMQVVPGTELPKTWLGVPMLVRNEVKGIVSLQNLDKEDAFTQSDIRLLNTLTNSMSQSLENARLFNETQRLLTMIENEMEIARQTQHSMLPRQVYHHPGYDFGALIIPARAVGGDFYDFIRLGKHRLAVVIGDVSDKGLHAALFMALTLSLVRVETGRRADPLTILQNVNRDLLVMNTSGMFVTLLYCVLDLKSGEVNYWRAGHLPPVVLDQNGQALEIGFAAGQPLGLFPDVRIDHQHFSLPEGGLALFFSDGLSETINSAGVEFGLKRVREVLTANHQASAAEICAELWRAGQDYCDSLDHQDDFTTVVVKRAP